MSEEKQKLMEGEIVEEDILDKTDNAAKDILKEKTIKSQKPPLKIKSLSKFRIRTVHLITLGILASTIIFISFTYKLLTTTQTQEQIGSISPKIPATPSPYPGSSEDEIKRQISQYDQKLSDLIPFNISLTYPIVDLAISFEK